MTNLVGPNGQPLTTEPPEIPPAEDVPVVEATTAFVVCWINGEVIVSADLDAIIVRDHEPTADEIHGAAAVLMKDRTAETAAQVTVGIIDAKQRAAVEKMREAQLAAQAQQLLLKERQ